MTLWYSQGGVLQTFLFLHMFYTLYIKWSRNRICEQNSHSPPPPNCPLPECVVCIPSCLLAVCVYKLAAWCLYMWGVYLAAYYLYVWGIYLAVTQPPVSTKGSFISVLWQLWNSERVLCNANHHLYIPQHYYESLKRMPLFNFSGVWNSEDNTKLNAIQHRYLNHVQLKT
jgi:hypothetical protein